MFELEISGKMYQFNFGMGFLRDINKTVTTKIEGVLQNVGLRFVVSRLAIGDTEALASVLMTANKGQNPRLTTMALDSYIDDPSTDIDTLFKTVTDFLSEANATKTTVLDVLKEIEKRREQTS